MAVFTGAGTAIKCDAEKVPFVTKEDLDLYQSPTDLIIKIGNFKRNLPLPLVLRKYQIAAAKLNEGELQVVFKEFDK